MLKKNQFLDHLSTQYESCQVRQADYVIPIPIKNHSKKASLI